jgi:hypothetical protein
MKNPKTPIKTDDWNHHMEDKREDPKNVKRRAAMCRNQRRERGRPSCGRKLSHPSAPPSNVAPHM